jgi:alkaline phosphatase D
MFSRRFFMMASGVALWVPASAHGVGHRQHFTLGVASGSPRPTSVVIWTRLAPDPLNGGGMPNGQVDVRYRVCKDAAMRQQVQQGMARTSEAKGHSVHVTLQGLEPGREYWYQFYFGDDESPVGRTRTSDPNAAEAKIALAYCQSYESGFYAAYRDMAEWAPDCVIHTGDYIYEGGVGKLGAVLRDVGGGERRVFETVRLNNGPEIVTLFDYRNRYALYRSDPDLQAAHAAAPWIVAMDDHEIDNNWAGDIPQDPDKQTPVEFLVRKIAALQAYYEHMPMERPPEIDGLKAQLQMYGLYRFGPAQVHLLDTRQFRSDQACGDGRKPMCADARDPKRTMLGATQEAWLADSLKSSSAPFNVIATQIWFTPYRYADNGQFAFATGGEGTGAAPEPDAPVVNLDSWDGYPAARQRLSDQLADGVSNPVFLTGDWHTAMASTIYQTPFDTRSKRIGHELVGSSISSSCPWARDMEQVRDANSHVAHLNGKQRGYLRTHYTKQTCTADFRVVLDAGQQDSAVVTDVELRTHEM